MTGAMAGFIRAHESLTASGMMVQCVQLRHPDEWGPVRAYVQLPYGTREWVAITWRDTLGDQYPQTLEGFHQVAANVRALLD